VLVSVKIGVTKIKNMVTKTGEKGYKTQKRLQNSTMHRIYQSEYALTPKK